jgi:hypothetical protein
VSNPFPYTARELRKAVKLLRFTARPSATIWDGFPYRIPVAFITSEDAPPLDRERAQRVLVDLAITFVQLRQKPQRPTRASVRVAERAVRRLRDTFKAAGASAQSIDQIVEQTEAALAQPMQRPPRRRDDPVRDWYLENLCWLWEQCGGATHTSGKTNAGQLVQFLQLASEPVFRHCGQKLLTPYAARGAVRKLRAERPN